MSQNASVASEQLMRLKLSQLLVFFPVITPTIRVVLRSRSSFSSLSPWSRRQSVDTDPMFDQSPTTEADVDFPQASITLDDAARHIF